MKGFQKYFPVVLFVVSSNVVLNFESVDEIVTTQKISSSTFQWCFTSWFYLDSSDENISAIIEILTSAWCFVEQHFLKIKFRNFLTLPPKIMRAFVLKALACAHNFIMS